MKENLYAWIKNLAVFYLLFTMVLHLVPAGKYEKYVRFFMGLLLILILLIPVFTLFGKAEELGESFQILYDKKEEERKVQEGENLKKMFIWKMPQCTRSNIFSPFTPVTANTAIVSSISVPWAAARDFIFSQSAFLTQMRST